MQDPTDHFIRLGSASELACAEWTAEALVKNKLLLSRFACPLTSDAHGSDIHEEV